MNFLVIVYCVTTLLAIFRTALSENLDNLINESLKRESMNPLHTLSRQRRYLTFPQDSSFQLVLDDVIAVVNHVNYITLSVTIALAWALPSEPPSELAEQLKDRLKEGIGEKPNLEIDAIKRISLPKSQQLQIKRFDIPNNLEKIPGQHLEQHRYSDNYPWQTHKPSYHYYDASPYTKPYMQMNVNNHTSYYANPFQQYTEINQRYGGFMSNKYPWWRLNGSKGNNQQLLGRHIKGKVRPTFQRNHKIYPIFGTQNPIPLRNRRSNNADSISATLDSIHIRHQRRTRYALYETIEKHLDRKKLNGHQCILRTLCETGQKSMEQNPSSFVAELMRAMFTLPGPQADEDTTSKSLHTKEQHYHDAQANEENCAAHYPKCEHSLWSSDFLS